MTTSKASEAEVRPFFQRIVSSLVALAIVWVVVAIVFGIYVKSAQGAVACLISTIAIFAIGWIAVALPTVAAGRRVVQISVWGCGLIGAAAGAIILFGLDREDLTYLLQHPFGWPALAAVSGAAGMLIYRLLIEPKTKN